MKRLFIYVEGMTEEIFVERILRHHLARRGVKVERPLAAKKDFDPDGPRGGFTNWPAMEADMRDWFADHPDTPGSEARFTTLLDLYALPKEVPGYPGLRAATTEAHVAAIEAALAAQLGEARFFPYLQRHEFEALLLAHPPALAHIFPTAAPALARPGSRHRRTESRGHQPRPEHPPGSAHQRGHPGLLRTESVQCLLGRRGGNSGSDARPLPALPRLAGAVGSVGHGLKAPNFTMPKDLENPAANR